MKPSRFFIMLVTFVLAQNIWPSSTASDREIIENLDMLTYWDVVESEQAFHYATTTENEDEELEQENNDE